MINVEVIDAEAINTVDPGGGGSSTINTEAIDTVDPEGWAD